MSGVFVSGSLRFGSPGRAQRHLGKSPGYRDDQPRLRRQARCHM